MTPTEGPNGFCPLIYTNGHTLAWIPLFLLQNNVVVVATCFYLLSYIKQG
jgi:hypothetical protein